ncbi:MAG TPA: hypothetical protein VN893_03060 [Bryobacteraceae bacterium]|nr:hypothetical protein [Bryobacteraceae bacterium]
MKKLTNTILALSAVAALGGTTGLYAQSSAVAKVPFGFTVNTVSLPPGDYELRALASESPVIRIVNLNTRRSVMVLAPASGSTYKGQPTDSGKVIFHRYGDRYFFSEVWSPGGLRGCAKPPKLEQELRASNPGIEMASVDITLGGAK